MSAPMDVAMDGSLVSDRLAKTDSFSDAPLNVAPLICTTSERSMQIDVRVELQPDAAPSAAEALQPVQAFLEHDTVSGRGGDITETTNVNSLDSNVVLVVTDSIHDDKVLPMGSGNRMSTLRRQCGNELRTDPPSAVGDTVEVSP